MSRPIMTRNGGRAPEGELPTRKIAVGAATLLLIAGAAYGIMHWLPNGSTGPSSAAAAPAKPVTTTTSTTPAPRSIAPTPVTTPPTTTAATPAGSPVTTAAAPTAPAPEPLAITQGRGGSTTTPGMEPTPTKPTPVNVLNPNPQVTPEVTPGTGTAGPQSFSSASSTQQVRTLMEAGDREMASNKLVEARVSFSKALMSTDIAKADQEVVRAKLSAINDDLLFSSRVTAGDPLVESYTIATGDSLERIKKRRDLAIDWKFLARVNKMSNPHALQVGHKIKLVRGPFHAVVHKNDFRLDVFAGSPDEPENWLYIRSFKVGLGADESSTPLGNFVIKSKKEHPDWRNPRTGQHFDADDPQNPIGNYWLGWEGLGDSSVYTGFGLHGTIDPDSIGKRKSMGCVRMGAEDIAEVYEMLVEQVSLVKIVDDDAPPTRSVRPAPATDMNK
jgi:hypothetical protein